MRIGTKTNLKTESFAFFEISRFATTEQQNSRRTAFALPIRVSIYLFRLPSIVNTIPRYLNVSTCCSDFSLTCRKHCLGRDIIPRSFWCCFAFLLSPTQQKTDQMRAEDPVEKIKHAAPFRPQNANGSSCSSTVTSLSRRLRLSIQFI